MDLFPHAGELFRDAEAAPERMRVVKTATCVEGHVVVDGSRLDGRQPEVSKDMTVAGLATNWPVGVTVPLRAIDTVKAAGRHAGIR
jgi:hypothetical protein